MNDKSNRGEGKSSDGFEFQSALAFASDGIFVVAGDGVIRECNAQGAALFGCDVEEVVGKHVSELIIPEEIEDQKSAIERLLAGETVVSERTLLRKGGGTVAVESSSRMTPTGLAVSILRDVSERRSVQERLRRNERLLRTLIDSMPMLVSFVDADERYRFNNQAYADWFEMTDPHQLEGTTVRQVVGEDAYEAIRPKLALALAGEEVKYEMALPYRRAGLRTVEAHYVPHFSDDGVVLGFFALVTDVTDRRRMEENLAKAEKLESVGVLAGGIAHDFNNLLTGILGNLNLARMKVEPGGDLDDRLDRAETGCLRARDLTSQFLTFARGGKPVKKTLGLAELLIESVDFAARGSSLKCEYDLSPALWPVSADRGQLNQVFNNLVLNAGQAMRVGGLLNVGAVNIVRPAGEVSGQPAERYVVVTFRDNGQGISADDVDKIFDPYFTTKKGGTGLGLTTSYSIIKSHGGFIEVESTPGEGTMFTVGLPATSGETPPVQRVRPRPVNREGRVLFMDDDEAVLEAVAPSLAAMGYRVVCAAHGEEAVELYGRAVDEGEAFDVVIMDLTVRGGTGGLECLRQLKEIDPDVVGVVSSGYSGDPVMAEYAGHGFRAVLEKPYTTGELASAFEKALAGT